MFSLKISFLYFISELEGKTRNSIMPKSETKTSEKMKRKIEKPERHGPNPEMGDSKFLDTKKIEQQIETNPGVVKHWNQVTPFLLKKIEIRSTVTRFIGLWAIL